MLSWPGMWRRIRLALRLAVRQNRALTRRMTKGLREPRDHIYTRGMLSVYMMTCLFRNRLDQVKKATSSARSSQKLMSKVSTTLGNHEMLLKSESGIANHCRPKTPPIPSADASVNKWMSSLEIGLSCRTETPFHVGRNVIHHWMSALASTDRWMR